MALIVKTIVLCYASEYNTSIWLTGGTSEKAWREGC